MSGNVRDRDIRRFLQELEHGIRDINRDHIRALIPELTRDNILSLEASAARLRAIYLEAACTFDAGAPDPAAVQALREKREAYQELRKAHEALLYAVERGYIDVLELKSDE